ncbi:MAG TPA: RNA polymerase sigma factor [Tepidisphaeraceae bacterium]|nr:RNA polymerase sigma factor [Tepidisphaeraceae bacterium]
MSDPSFVSDLDLLRAAKGGNDAAFHTLVDRHAKALFRIALSLCGNRTDAEDIVQETFLGAYRGMKNFAERSSVKTWLMQILTRQSHKAWHKSKNQRDSLPINEQTADDRSASRVEDRMDVMQMLQSLPQPHREVIVLRHLQGLSYDEMARVLNLPQGTVESRLTRARAELRSRLNGFQAE